MKIVLFTMFILEANCYIFTMIYHTVYTRVHDEFFNPFLGYEITPLGLY